MKVSTKGRYALRLMLDIALNSGGRVVPLGDVARRQEISEKYLEQIVMQLSRGGLVRSVRGAGGGYLLTRDPDAYTVGEILRLMEGSLIPVECAGRPECCDRLELCATAEVWQKIRQAVEQVVDHITLADLVGRCAEKVMKEM